MSLPSRSITSRRNRSTGPHWPPQMVPSLAVNDTGRQRGARGGSSRHRPDDATYSEASPDWVDATPASPDWARSEAEPAGGYRDVPGSEATRANSLGDRIGQRRSAPPPEPARRGRGPAQRQAPAHNRSTGD